MDSLTSTDRDGKMALTMDVAINKMYKVYGTILETYTKDETNSLLLADRFLHDEDIQHLLDYADQEAWDYVYANRNKYSHRIRRLIEPRDFYPSNFKMKLRDMTDKDMEDIKNQRDAQKIAEMEKRWESIKDNISERPVDELDDELDDAWEALSAAKDRMTEYLARKKKTYVPPSARRVVDEEQQEIEEEIAECQKEFNAIEKRIEKADSEYLSKKKDEYFQKWMCEMSSQISA